MTNDSPEHTPQPRSKTNQAIRTMVADDRSDSNDSMFASRVYDPCCGSGGFFRTAAPYLFVTTKAGDRVSDYWLVNPPFAGT